MKRLLTSGPWGRHDEGRGVVYDDPANVGRQIRVMDGYPPGSRPDPLT